MPQGRSKKPAPPLGPLEDEEPDMRARRSVRRSDPGGQQAPRAPSGFGYPMATSTDSRKTRESDLSDFLNVLRWRWKSILLVLAIGLGISIPYVESLPSKYDASAIVAVEPRPDVPSAGADTVRVVGPKYVAYVTAPATLAKVAPRVEQSPSTLEHAVDASLKVDTGNLTITARMRSPGVAARIANALADQVVAFSRTDKLLSGQIVARALPPGSPAAPARRLIEAAVVIVALLIGIGIAFLQERGQPRLRSWRELASSTGYPVLGRIPPARRLRSQLTHAFADPHVASAFRTLRANLEPQLRSGELKLLGVTSPSIGDGKTTVATLLGEALSRLDQRVLVIDADLRRPRMAAALGLNTNGGLSAVLEGSLRLRDAVQRGWRPGLSILPTAPNLDPGDLIATRLDRVLKYMKQKYDVIVVDAPPLLGSEDARAIAPLVDGMLLVVRKGTPVEVANEAIHALENLDAPLVGVVGNRMKAFDTYYGY
jgi:capsular exopolysaccharide synthesis family protein